MAIEKVDATIVSVPLEKNYGGSSYSAATRVTLILEIRTSDGNHGLIYSGDERDHPEELRRMIETDLAPQVVGRDEFDITGVYESLLRNSPTSADTRNRRLYMHALSAVNTAMWDLLGRRLGVPLYQLWGGGSQPPSLPAMVIGGYYEEGKTLSGLADELAGYAEQGFGGLKLKVGRLSPVDDLERLRVARETLGEDFVIACDANQGWDLAEATEFEKGARDFGIAWFEEPVTWYDQYRAMRRLRQRGEAPVCAGQSEVAVDDACHLITSGCVDVINFDASWGGGPTGWWRVAHLAALNDVRLAHHEEPHISSQLMAASGNALAVEFFHAERDPVWHRMLANRPAVSGGRVRPLDGPGFGLELDADFVRRHTVG